MASKIVGGVYCNLSEKEASNIGVIKRKSTNRHKKVKCYICNKTMQSNNLNRHIVNKHKYIYSMDEDEARKEIVKRKSVNQNNEIKQLNIERIVKEEGATIECFAQETKLHSLVPLQRRDPQEVRHCLLIGQREYSQKIELGKIVYNILTEGDVALDSLGKEYRDAMKAYMNKKSSGNCTDTDARYGNSENSDYSDYTL